MVWPKMYQDNNNNENNNNQCICIVQNKWSSGVLHHRAGVESLQFLHKCLN